MLELDANSLHLRAHGLELKSSSILTLGETNSDNQLEEVELQKRRKMLHSQFLVVSLKIQWPYVLRLALKAGLMLLETRGRAQRPPNVLMDLSHVLKELNKRFVLVQKRSRPNARLQMSVSFTTKTLMPNSSRTTRKQRSNLAMILTGPFITLKSTLVFRSGALN